MPSCSKCGGALDGATGDVCTTCLLKMGVSGEIEKPFDPGTNFHGLEIVQILGRGGMGVVYKARQPQLDRFVAVKVLPRALAADPEFAKRFLQEAKALASLTHPNIVAIHDFGQDDGRYFIVMEFVDGTSLRSILREKTMTAEQSLKLAPLLCDALEFAHQEGVVHRDIKPENILLDRRGRVKIADFGLAKMIGGDRTVIQNLTQSNVVMGTMHYMAPEQLENTKSVDHRADIYSLGVVLYEMLTGELPIGRFDPPSKRVNVDVRLDDVVMRTLEKQPDKRYQSMGAVRDDVTRISEVKAPPPAVKGPGLWPWKAAVGLLVLAMTVILVRGRLGNAPVVTPTPTPSPSPAAIDPWSAATLLAAERPEGWKTAQDDWEGDSRADVMESARWFALQEQAGGIRRARRIALKGPNDWELWFYAWQFSDTASLDAALKIFQSKWLPQLNHFLLDKGDVLVFVSAERNGRVAPVVEALEDRLRVKLGIAPAKRVDETAIRPDDLPAGWKPGTLSTDIGAVTAALRGLALPPAGALRDGWTGAWSDPTTPGRAAEFLSLRFYDYEAAKAFATQLRTVDPPADAELRVLYDYDRVVAGFAPAKTELAPFESIVAAVAKRMGYSSDDLDIKDEALDVSLADGSLSLSFALTGVSGRELTRAGSWTVTIWSGNRKGLELAAKPSARHHEGKQRVDLKWTIEGDLKRFLETLPKWIQLRVKWSAAEGARTIDLQYTLEGKFPASFDKAFGSLFLTDKELPMGWRGLRRWQNLNVPVIAMGAEEKGPALEVVGSDAAGVDMAWLHAFEPAEKLEGFKALVLLIARVPEPAAKVALLEKIGKVALGGKWDRQQVVEKGEIVAVVLLAGTNAEASQAAEKLAAILRARLEGR